MAYRTPFRLALFVALLLGQTALAQPATAPWTDAEARAAARDAADQIARFYQDESLAARIADAIRIETARGTFDGAANGETFAARLLTALRAAHDDRHFAVDFHPAGAPPSAPPIESAADGPADPASIAWGHFLNGGIDRAARLAGNIGYLVLSGMPDAAASAERAAAAIAFLGQTDGLIIDLRQCHGGDPAMAGVWQSVLTDGKAKPYGQFVWRSGAPPRLLLTPALPAAAVYGADKPVFLLVGPGTISACEELAYTLAERKRATLVGEPTAGGANPGRPVRIDRRFTLFMPVGRYVSRFGGGNWEGKGIAPHVSAPTRGALGTAHKLALERSAARPNHVLFGALIEGEVREADFAAEP